MYFIVVDFANVSFSTFEIHAFYIEIIGISNKKHSRSNVILSLWEGPAEVDYVLLTTWTWSASAKYILQINYQK